MILTRTNLSFPFLKYTDSQWRPGFRINSKHNHFNVCRDLSWSNFNDSRESREEGWTEGNNIRFVCLVSVIGERKEDKRAKRFHSEVRRKTESRESETGGRAEREISERIVDLQIRKENRRGKQTDRRVETGAGV